MSATMEALELELPDGSRRRVVVRRHGAAAWKPLPADVTLQEFRLLRALHDAGLPVPEPLLLDARGELLPTPGLVLAWVEGRHEAEVADALEQEARFLADLHRLDAHRLGVTDLPAREDPVAGALELLPATGHARIRELLRARGPLATHPRPSVLHGDFWPGNVLWRDGRIAAVLDWEDAAVGDPLSDLAAARLERLYVHPADAVERFTRAYLEGAPVHAERLAIWELYVATAARASMHQWALPPDREAHARRVAGAFARRAEARLLGEGIP